LALPHLVFPLGNCEEFLMSFFETSLALLAFALKRLGATEKIKRRETTWLKQTKA
jgi:hypothetical protein